MVNKLKRKPRQALTAEQIAENDPMLLCKRMHVKYTEADKLDPKTLTFQQRNICIEYLYVYEGLEKYAISNFLKVSRGTVNRICRLVDTRLAMQLKLKGFSTWDVVARLKKHRDGVKRRAMERGNLTLYDQAEYRFWEEMRKLGVVYEKPAEANVNVTFSGKLAGALVDIANDVEEQEIINLDKENDVYALKKANTQGEG